MLIPLTINIHRLSVIAVLYWSVKDYDVHIFDLKIIYDFVFSHPSSTTF